MTTIDRIEKFRELGFLSEVRVSRLIAEGYFTAPASTKYHGNYKGGLFDHSYEVAKTLVELTEKNNLKWENPFSPWVVGLFHDLCKMDAYRYIDDTDTYEYNNETLYKGHGDKSVILLSSYLVPTPEEVACIRYHMGAFTDKEEWEDYTRAIRKYNNVLWTHHADMIASQIKGV